MLNLINNAFQACAERSRSASADQSNRDDSPLLDPVPERREGVRGEQGQVSDTSQRARYPKGMPAHNLDSLKSDYQPKVTLSTQQLNNSTTITIQDNGPGIPDSIKDKIFQPFFTTKPTGQGTGLGLSLSYDIVKAHGGEITVNSEEGVGTKFVVSLPFA
ncbi:MAG: hypothetical protein KJP00_05830 [Bacteroidia bacterium]|nr:hypothetical protein [Bacteroidia bacterium]